MTTNRELRRVQRWLQEQNVVYMLWGAVTIAFGLVGLWLNDFNSMVPIVYICLNCCLLLGCVSIRSIPTVKALNFHGVLVVVTGILTIYMSAYFLRQGSGGASIQLTKSGFLIGVSQLFSGLNTIYTQKKTERLVKDNYFLCPSCSFEQWSGYQTCQKCGHQFQTYE